MFIFHTWFMYLINKQIIFRNTLYYAKSFIVKIKIYHAGVRLKNVQQLPLSSLRCNHFTIHVEWFLFIIRAATIQAILAVSIILSFLSELHTVALSFTSPQLLYWGDATLHLRVNASVRAKQHSCVSSGHGPLEVTSTKRVYSSENYKHLRSRNTSIG